MEKKRWLESNQKTIYLATVHVVAFWHGMKKWQTYMSVPAEIQSQNISTGMLQATLSLKLMGLRSQVLEIINMMLFKIEFFCF